MSVADETLGAAVVTAGEAAALLARVDAEVRRLDDEVRASAAGKVFRRAWRRFVVRWRGFFDAEKGHPSRGAARAAVMFGTEARDWRQALRRELAAASHEGMGADASGGLITAGTLTHEAQAIAAEIATIDARVQGSAVGERFRRAWATFVANWQSFHAGVRDGRMTPDAATFSRLRQYRGRATMWAGALAREQVAASVSAGEAVGALIVTPGAIKDEIETVNAGVKQLDSDIMSSKVRDAFKKAWRLFASEWQRFYASKQGWWARSWGSTWEKAVDYRKRVDEWRTAFQREGGQSTGPTLNVPVKGGGGSFKWWAIGGLVVGGAILGAKALR